MKKNLLKFNKKGVTITSLTIYVIVETVIVGILVFLNANFFSNINDLTNKANVVSESLNFKSAFIRDLKSENDMKVTDFNNNIIRLSNNVKYEIRVLDKEAEDKKFAIYRNDVQIAKSVVSHTAIGGYGVKEGPFFEYDIDTNTVKLGIKFSDGENTYIENGTYVVGKAVKAFKQNSTEQKEDLERTLIDGTQLNSILKNTGATRIVFAHEDDYLNEIFGVDEYVGVGKENKSSNKKENDIKLYTVTGTDNIKTAYILSDYIICFAADSSGMFNGLTDVTSIEFKNVNTQSVTNAASMFNGCEQLLKLDLSNFRTYTFTSMNNMFNGCSSLNELNISKFDTQNVTGMNSMFNECTSLNKIDVSSFNTQDVSDMSSMFQGCSSLNSLVLTENFVTENVIYMGNMFNGCNSLSEIDVSNFNTQKVTNMENIFKDCKQLLKLDVSNFSTGLLTSMNGMFSGCSSLTELNISTFNTQNITNMSNMFQGCSSLKEIDIANFDTQNVTNMTSMFENCSELITIYVGQFWNIDNVTDSSLMFNLAENLIGENGTTYDSTRVDQIYAFVDNAEHRGYLTYTKDEIRIGFLYYDTFEEAINEVQEGDMISGVNDFTIDSSVTVSQKNVTLDIQDYTVTLNSDVALIIEDGFTMKNANIVGNGNYIYSTQWVTSNLIDCNMVDTKISASRLDDMLYITGGTYTNCTVETNMEATSIFEDVTYTGMITARYEYGQNGGCGKIQINSGNFVGATISKATTSVPDENIVLYGGIYDTNTNTQYLADGYIFVQNVDGYYEVTEE